MSVPPKPWENNTQNNNSPSYIPGAELATGQVTGVRRAMIVNGLPPLPPRMNRTAMYPRYSPYGGTGGFSSFGGGYGHYGGLGGYGGFPYGGMRGHEFENRYVQIAEESAAPAFESIESFVRGFSAVTMMLESTFQAVHMSFRAVLSVAENMSRMKAAIFDFLSALTIFKTVYFFYRKVLHLLGLVNGAEVSWQQAEMATAGGSMVVKSSSSSKWPMIAFLGAIVAGPTLVYKYLLPNGIPDDEDVTLIAAFDFDAEQPQELSFRKGDQLLTKRSHLKKGWIMARKGSSKGYIPSSRIKILIRKTDQLPPSTSSNVPILTPQQNPQQALPTRDMMFNEMADNVRVVSETQSTNNDRPMMNQYVVYPPIHVRPNSNNIPMEGNPLIQNIESDINNLNSASVKIKVVPSVEEILDSLKPSTN